MPLGNRRRLARGQSLLMPAARRMPLPSQFLVLGRPQACSPPRVPVPRPLAPQPLQTAHSRSRTRLLRRVFLRSVTLRLLRLAMEQRSSHLHRQTTLQRSASPVPLLGEQTWHHHRWPLLPSPRSRLLLHRVRRRMLLRSAVTHRRSRCSRLRPTRVTLRPLPANHLPLHLVLPARATRPPRRPQLKDQSLLFPLPAHRVRARRPRVSRRSQPRPNQRSARHLLSHPLLLVANHWLPALPGRRSRRRNRSPCLENHRGRPHLRLALVLHQGMQRSPLGSLRARTKSRSSELYFSRHTPLVILD
ncbi:hypothetical protein BKA83DRAFT_4191833 [Pisolithus microcarpus]|nr:hypothetical protein BKA83DRAFT_4191833 [Pisolithus microcarpus]